jgi:hypothetical protein
MMKKTRLNRAGLDHIFGLINQSGRWNILFAVTEFLGIGSHVPLLLVIDAI